MHNSSTSKDVVIYYQGGTGGYFTFYYILASDSNILAKTPRNEKIYLGKNKKLLDTVFYSQFKKSIDSKDWKKHEKGVCNLYNSDEKDTKFRQLLLFNNFIPENFTIDPAQHVVISPFIKDKKKWFRMCYHKRCYTLAGLSDQELTYSVLKRRYKDFLLTTHDGVPAQSDYVFDLLSFLQDKNERRKLCDVLKIKINDRMEEYLTHYLQCHAGFLHKLLD